MKMLLENYVASGSGVSTGESGVLGDATGISTSGGHQERMRCSKKFYFCEIISFGFPNPISLNQF